MGDEEMDVCAKALLFLAEAACAGLGVEVAARAVPAAEDGEASQKPYS